MYSDYARHSIHRRKVGIPTFNFWTRLAFHGMNAGNSAFRADFLIYRTKTNHTVLDLDIAFQN